LCFMVKTLMPLRAKGLLWPTPLIDTCILKQLIRLLLPIAITFITHSLSKADIHKFITLLKEVSIFSVYQISSFFKCVYVIFLVELFILFLKYRKIILFIDG
jgi:hypothetical protein